MNNSTYNKLAEVTLSTQFHATTTEDQLLLHAAMGLQTEIGELFAANMKGRTKYWNFDRVNFKEEIGDGLWYLTIPQRLFGVDFKEMLATHPYEQATFKYLTVDSNPTHFLEILNQDTTEFLDVMKKRVFYGRELNREDLVALLLSIFQGFKELLHLLGEDIGKIMDTNIKKLNARYGDKFSSFMADNRDLEAEFAILSAPSK